MRVHSIVLGTTPTSLILGWVAKPTICQKGQKSTCAPSHWLSKVSLMAK